MSLAVVDVRFEHHPVPAIGIGETKPRISWRFAGDIRDFFQSAYQLQVKWQRESELGSYEVQSAESVLVPWPSEALRSGEGAQVRVRVTGDSLTGWTDWSSWSEVEAGLLEPADWAGASLIHPSETLDEVSRPVSFRHGVRSTEGKVVWARLYISAQGIYEARLDGRKIGDEVLSPGWTSYSHRLLCQTYDVTSFFSEQKAEHLEIDVAEGWFTGRLGFLGGRRNIYGDVLGLIAKLRLRMADGSVIDTCTGSGWVCSYGPILLAELYDGERYNAGWIETDQQMSTRWFPVRQSDKVPNLVAPDGPPVRKTQEIEPISIETLDSGQLLADFGQNFVGHVRLDIRFKSPTKRIRVQHAEVLENGRCSTRPLRYAKACDEVLTGDDCESQSLKWEPKFTFHGFRYVEIDGAHRSEIEGITGVVIGTDMTRSGYFSCSNPLFNQLHENTVWSMRSNFVSIPTDCPQRDERLGWTGDINMFADTANYLFDCRGMLCSWLKDLAAEQNQGIVPLTIPNVMPDLNKEAHAIWGDVVIMLPWSLYRASGDKSILLRHHENMKKWLQAIPRKYNGLWDYQSSWKLGDWLDPAAPPDDCGNGLTDPLLVADSFLVHVTGLMRNISHLLALEEDHAHYAAQEKALHEAFQHEYVTASGRMACDTQTAYALAINFSLIESPKQLQRATERLSTLISLNSRFKIATGFAGTPYLGHALTEMGLSNLFYRMLLHRQNPSWLYPVTMGATTIWERWDSMLPDGTVNPGEMTSFNHYALGAICQWMHRTIAGIKPLEPGWRSFAVEPVPGGGLDWAEGRYLSAYGEIVVQWRLGDNVETEGGIKREILVNLAVPPNSSAQVKLPGWSDVHTFGSGRHEWRSLFAEDTWPPVAKFPPYLERDDQLPEDEKLPCPWID